MPVLDLTDLYSDPFEYEIRKGEDRVKVVCDFEQIAIDLYQRIPTALQPSDQVAEDGHTMTGLEVVFDCFKRGVKQPDNLPSIDHVSDAIAKAFHLPLEPGNGILVRMKLFSAYLVEQERRSELKKNTQG